MVAMLVCRPSGQRHTKGERAWTSYGLPLLRAAICLFAIEHPSPLGPLHPFTPSSVLSSEIDRLDLTADIEDSATILRADPSAYCRQDCTSPGCEASSRTHTGIRTSDWWFIAA
ncbi:unnamed protein product [Sympodiomycopsis kandeliae]